LNREPTGLTCREGVLALSGALDAATVPGLWQVSDRELAVCRGPDVTMDLKAVDRVDSAGLALLVAWLRLAKRRSLSIRYRDAPAQLLALASANRLEHLALMLAEGRWEGVDGERP